jgi:hypothetical protein
MIPNVPSHAKNEPRTHRDQHGLFSLTVPQGWLLDASGQHGSRAVLLHPAAEEGFQANVNVVVCPNPHLSPDEFLTFTRLQLKQLTGLERLDVDKLAGRRDGGHVLEWAAQAGPAVLRHRQLLVFDVGRVFVVTATALDSRFEAHRPEFAAIMDSFRLGVEEAVVAPSPRPSPVKGEGELGESSTESGEQRAAATDQLFAGQE